MRRNFIRFVLIAMAGRPVWAQESRPVLCLDPPGHFTYVCGLVWTPDGKQIISSGDDKLLRIWDAATGELTARLRCPVESGPGGALREVALSPDGRLLAVAGWRPANNVRIFDLATGRTVRVLPTQSYRIHCLSWPSQGGLIAAAGDDPDLIYLWRTDTWQPMPAVRFADRIGWPGMRLSPDCRYLCWGPTRGGNRVRDLRSGAEWALPFPRWDWANLHVEWSPISAGIAWLDQHGNLGASATAPGTEQSRMVPVAAEDLVYTSKGDILLSDRGLRLLDGRSLAVLRSWDDWPRFSIIALSPDEKRLAGCTRDGTLSVRDLADGRMLWQRLSAGVATTAAGVSAQRDGIAWLADGHWCRFDGGSVSSLPGAATPPAGSRAASDRDGFTAVPDEAGVVTVKSAGAVLYRAPSWSVFALLSGGWLATQNEIATISLIDASGASRQQLTGFTTTARWLAPCVDSPMLWAGSEDKVIRAWPLNSPATSVPPLLSLFPGADGEWIAWTEEGYYACSPGAERWIGWQLNHGDADPEFYPAYQFRKQFYRPDVIARVLEAGSVARAVALAGSERRAGGDAEPVGPSLARIVPPRVSFLEPSFGAAFATSRITVRVRATDPNGRPVTKLTIFRNGRDQAARGLPPNVARTGELTETVELVPGRNAISVSAVNDAGSESVPVGVVVTYNPPVSEAVPKPSLYVLAVGVSAYSAPDLRLKYAAKDARDLVQALAAQQGRLYGIVQARVLTDDKATKNDILDGLEWLSRQTTARDTAFVFLAGHGLADAQGNYFYLPTDADPDRLMRTGVRWSELQEVLRQLPAKVIAAVDTCHSGGVTGARGIRPRIIADALRALGSTEVGVVTFSSCQPNELSLEQDEWGHGAFTRALLDGLAGQADLNRDRSLTLSEFEVFVLERVKELTGGRQHPSLQRAPTIPGDWVLAMLN